MIDAHPRKHGASEAVLERLRALEHGEQPPEPRVPSPLPAPPAAAPPKLDEAALRLEAELRADGRAPRTDAELAAALGLDASAASERFRALEQAGRAVRVGRSQHYAREPLAQLTERIVAICERDGRATIAGVRDELGTSRKYAQALLEHLDSEKVTRRLGDAHVLRRR